MKVHPVPPLKRNISFRYGSTPSLTAAQAILGLQKKLRRLPHIFSKVLELPFGSNADVSVQEDEGGFQFIVAADDVPDDVRAHAIHIHPGVTKVVIRDGSGEPGLLVDDLELDRWRFRLPSCTLPELASASYVDGELVVTIPKGRSSEESGDEDEVWEQRSGDPAGRLMVV